MQEDAPGKHKQRVHNWKRPLYIGIGSLRIDDFRMSLMWYLNYLEKSAEVCRENFEN